jgi:hypothetical protein
LRPATTPIAAALLRELAQCGDALHVVGRVEAVAMLVLLLAVQAVAALPDAQRVGGHADDVGHDAGPEQALNHFESVEPAVSAVQSEY